MSIIYESNYSVAIQMLKNHPLPGFQPLTSGKRSRWHTKVPPCFWKSFSGVLKEDLFYFFWIIFRDFLFFIYLYRIVLFLADMQNTRSMLLNSIMCQCTMMHFCTRHEAFISPTWQVLYFKGDNLGWIVWKNITLKIA